MNAPVVTFFNNKGGVGKTSLVYHLAWMYAELGTKVIAVDMDPQANLTNAFLRDDEIAALWDEQKKGSTMYQCVQPLIVAAGGVADPVLQKIPDSLSLSLSLSLLAGNMALSEFENTLSEEWPKSLDDTQSAIRSMKVLSAFWRIIQNAVQQSHAELVLVDVGPNLGAINRSVFIASDFFVIPLAADLFSLRGLQNLGPAMLHWKRAWEKRRNNYDDIQETEPFPMPAGNMKPLGYICQQHGVRLDRPVKAYDRWIQRVPNTYREYVLDKPANFDNDYRQDSHCIATVKHYRSLVPMAQEHRKPIFHLTVADGAIGNHLQAVHAAYADYKKLAEDIRGRIAQQQPMP